MIAALTGGIACGKSSVAEIFSRLGWIIVDADGICRELYLQKVPELISALRSKWPHLVAGDGTVNKAGIAEIVFSSEQERNWLDELIHPLIKRRADELISASPKDKNIIFDVPLLFEKGWERFFSPCIAVWSNRAAQYERLAKRGWSVREIENRIGSQISADEKLERADFGLINSGSPDFLFNQCVKLEIFIRN